MNALDASRIYLIGHHHSDGGLTPDIVGGKAAHLARLDRLGLRVPPALALPAALCREYMDSGRLPEDFRARLAGAIRQLEDATGCTLGGRRPLLMSIRSSPPTSMPGMLRTILDVGMTDTTVTGLIRRTGNPWLAWDVYRRFTRSYGETVCGYSPSSFDQVAADHLSRAGVEAVQDLDPLAMRELARDSAAALAANGPGAIPVDPLEQVLGAIEAVFASWSSTTARDYRQLNGLDERTGTGALIQTMVYGNSGCRSGSGVGFTRNPATGAPGLYLDFLFNAQGEDVVAGRLAVQDGGALSAAMPDVWAQLSAAAATLEREFLDMQDFEFTVEEGQLYFLQTRAAKRTPWAALRIATDLAAERLIDEDTALGRLDGYDLDSIARVVVQPRPADQPVGHATAASVGVAVGGIVFSAARATELAAERPVILVRSELTTDDIAGLAASEGVLTTFGGRTSHAAVVARQLGKVCLVGCTDLRVDESVPVCRLGGRRFHEGDVLTLDGESGLVYPGALPVVTERPAALEVVAGWREQLANARV